ncbi:MAG: ThiF family adenylyltransferase [Acidobacteria bacterium]|nr:ThiF family adenylyltransferase [Acidobacteriota bacterium]
MSLVEVNEINRRWATPELFYAERDNRTMLEVQDLARYAARPVEIRVDPREAHELAVQRMTLLACNLTARWAREVRVVLPPSIRLAGCLRRDGSDTLDLRVISEMQAADPFGCFLVLSPGEVRQSDLIERPLRLRIGSWREPMPVGEEISADDYVITASGWSAIGRRGRGLGDEDRGHLSAVSAAAGLAASIGVADIFKRAIGHGREHWVTDFAWCMWSHTLTQDVPARIKDSHVSEELDLGQTLLAGVGAIGSALVYLMDMMELRGRLTLLDRDRVELSNLNRSPLFFVTHVLNDELKTAAAANYLRRHELQVRVVDGTWHEHAREVAREVYDVWVSFTNEDGAWAEVPFQLPPVVLHGTTTSGWGFGAGRHIPRRDDCTLCRMPRPEAEFRGPCAEGEIEAEPEGESARASLPFLSAASASLVLAELSKLDSPEVLKLPNDIAADLRYGLPAVMALTRLANQACRGCRAAASKLWERRGGRGRYRPYSEAA